MVYLPDSLIKAASHAGPVAFDTETSGLRWWRDEVGVMSFAWGPTEDDALATRDVEAGQVALQCRFDANMPTVAHNSSFDLHFMQQRGVRIRWSALRDTLLMARLFNNLGQHDLDALGLSMLGIPKGKDELKLWMRKNSSTKARTSAWAMEHGREPTYLDVPDEVLIPYAKRDAIVTWRLNDAFQNYGLPLLPREMKIRQLMFDAETRGVLIDEEAATRRLEQARRELAALEAQLQEQHAYMLDGDIDLDSDEQMRRWLFKDLGLSVVGTTEKQGLPQVNEYMLKSNVHPVARLLSTRNHRVKSVEYLTSYLALMDGRCYLHPSINTMQARTHRFSLGEPNLQQIPVRKDRFKIRQAFSAGGGWFLGADYNKQELRIAAEEAGDVALLRDLLYGRCLCEETSYWPAHGPECGDVYVAMARAMLGKDIITDSERNAAKVAVLSIIYGAGAPKVAESFTVNTGKPYSKEQAKGIRDGFLKAYPNISGLMNRMQMQARTGGRVTNRWNRMLYVEPNRAYVATDYLVQSSGRDVLADAILQVGELLPKYGGHLILPIHDELVSWLPEEPSPELMATYGEAMVSHKFSSPLTATPKKGRTLAEIK